MAIRDYLEYFLSWCLKDIKGHDARLFSKGPAFVSLPQPTIDITSPTCGQTGSYLDVDFTQMGENHFPTLIWSLPSTDVKEYILVCEDADIPLPGLIAQRHFHGLYYAIPPTTSTIKASDFEVNHASSDGENLIGGFKCTKTVRGVPYAGPRPLLGHGPHRYYYQLVALKEPLDLQYFKGPPSKAQLAAAIVGKVLAWGQWVGVHERKWD